jgi:aryl-alcohol dehydrogenase-like predicted oxidoreductase
VSGPLRQPLGTTGLDVFPLCLGSNVFGWTLDDAASFAVLDAYVAGGGNFIDTADVYSVWGEGNSGGESERIIGAWMRSRGNRDDLVIATKVGKLPGSEGLSEATIERSIAASLERLGTDRLDVYWAHMDDEATPLDETLGAFDALVRAGAVRHIGASNHTAPRLAAALEVSRREGFAAYTLVQPQYSLVERAEYEAELAPLCEEHEIACVPFWALARGFLTGKYRPGGPAVESVRAAGALEFLDDRGVRVLAALDEVAGEHGTGVAAIALAWVAAQPTVAAPIASARTPEQLTELLEMARLTLSAGELASLAAASA